MNSVVVSRSEDALFQFANVADSIFAKYDDVVIQRVKTKSANIDARYVCQFTFQQLNRQAGGLRGVADRLAEKLGTKDLAPYAASSICDARRKFPAELFLDLNKGLLEILRGESTSALWHGRRRFGIDGSKISVPRTLVKSGFKVEKVESHYPTGRLSCLYEVGTELIHDLSLSSHCDERRSAMEHFSSLMPNDVVIYDRGYFGFKLVAKHEESKTAFVMRFSENTGVKQFEDFINKNQGNDTAQSIVAIAPEGTRTKQKLFKQFPSCSGKFSVRLIKYTYAGNPYYLVTSLVNIAEFPLEEFPDLYHSRWGVEEAFKQIKVYILKKEFHTTTYHGVCQEIYASALLSNISRVVTNEAEKNHSSSKKNKESATSSPAVASEQIIRLFTNDHVRHGPVPRPYSPKNPRNYRSRIREN